MKHFPKTIVDMLCCLTVLEGCEVGAKRGKERGNELEKLCKNHRKKQSLRSWKVGTDLASANLSNLMSLCGFVDKRG